MIPAAPYDNHCWLPTSSGTVFPIALNNGGSPLTCAEYTVTLQFAENYFGVDEPGGVGSRVFGIEVEGTTINAAYDVFAAAGGAGIPVDVVVGPVSVTDGVMDVNLTAVTQNPMINGIELVEGDPLPPSECPEPTAISLSQFDVSDANGAMPFVLVGLLVLLSVSGWLVGRRRQA